MATSTYRLGTFAFQANVSAGLVLTDVDLNAFSADILARMNTMVPGTLSLLAGSGVPGMARSITLGDGFSLVNGVLTFTVSGNGSGNGGGTAPALTATPPLSIVNGAVGLAQSGAMTGQALVWSGTAWAPATIGTPQTSITVVTVDGSTIPATSSSPYQMAAMDNVVAVNKTTGAATKILLPTNAPVGVRRVIIDAKGDADTNNITVGTTGTINGLAMLIIQNRRGVLEVLQTAANTWSIV